jgi:hypothetical protein
MGCRRYRVSPASHEDPDGRFLGRAPGSARTDGAERRSLGMTVWGDGRTNPAIPYSLFPIPPPDDTDAGAETLRTGTRSSSAYRVWYFRPRKTIVPICGMLIISWCFSPNPQERFSSVGSANSASASA